MCKYGVLKKGNILKVKKWNGKIWGRNKINIASNKRVQNTTIMGAFRGGKKQQSNRFDRQAI